MDVLITGGCGFIGVNLVNNLLQKGDYKIRILDNLSIGNVHNVESIAKEYDKRVVEINATGGDHYGVDAIELIVGDIRDKSICMEACKGVDAVVHLAAHAGVVPSIEDPYFDFEVNTLGTLNLLHASAKHKVDKFILASSNAPLGDQAPPMDEDKVPAPLSPYGASKLACEGYCSAFQGSYGLKTVVLRFSNAYGPYSLHKNSVIARFIKDALVKGELIIYGDGTQTRDFIHVDDLCNTIKLISELSGQSVWGETFNLGTGKETSILELVDYMRELFKGTIKVTFEPARAGEITMNYSNTKKAKTLLGFEPQVDLKDGLKQVYGWFAVTSADCLRNAQVLSGSE